MANSAGNIHRGTGWELVSLQFKPSRQASWLICFIAGNGGIYGNVGKTLTNHPQNHHFWMAGLHQFPVKAGWSTIVFIPWSTIFCQTKTSGISFSKAHLIADLEGKATWRSWYDPKISTTNHWFLWNQGAGNDKTMEFMEYWILCLVWYSWISTKWLVENGTVYCWWSAFKKQQSFFCLSAAVAFKCDANHRIGIKASKSIARYQQKRHPPGSYHRKKDQATLVKGVRDCRTCTDPGLGGFSGPVSPVLFVEAQSINSQLFGGN